MSNIIHLAFKSPHVQDDMFAMLSCKHCKNKTFTFNMDDVGGFPLMKCAACSAHIGRMGWVHNDDPAVAGDPA